MFRKLIAKFTCDHELEHIRNIYGDEINHTPNYCRSSWICIKCKKIVYRDALYNPENDSVVKVEPPEVVEFNWGSAVRNAYGEWTSISIKPMDSEIDVTRAEKVELTDNSISIDWGDNNGKGF